MSTRKTLFFTPHKCSSLLDPRLPGPCSQPSTFPVPCSFTTHTYNHTMDNSLDPYSPKGSIMRPVCLSTRLLVARKSLETKKKVRLPDFQPVNIIHPSRCHGKLKHETSCTQQRQSVKAWLSRCSSCWHNTAGLLTSHYLNLGSLSCWRWLTALINTDEIGSRWLSAEMASSRSPLRVASDWDAGMEGRMGLVRLLGSSLSLSDTGGIGPFIHARYWE